MPFWQTGTFEILGPGEGRGFLALWLKAISGMNTSREDPCGMKSMM
jgi:hypothetical protein